MATTNVKLLYRAGVGVCINISTFCVIFGTINGLFTFALGRGYDDAEMPKLVLIFFLRLINSSIDFLPDQHLQILELTRYIHICNMRRQTEG